MRVSPRPAVIEPDPVTQQQLGESVPGAHQIFTQLLPGANQIAQRFLFLAGHPDRVKLAGHQQPHQMFGIPQIGLHPVARRAWDLRRRRDHAPDTAPGQFARERVAGRSGLVGRPDWARQPCAERCRRVRFTAHPEVGELARLGVQDRRHDLGGVHVQADKGSSLCHGWLLLCDCGPPRGVQPRG